MLGGKKGLRDMSRGFEDISKAKADMKIARAKTPEEALGLMEAQRDRHLELAAKHQSKARGIFTGPAELRAAKASEANANQCQRKIDKLTKKNPHLQKDAVQPVDQQVEPSVAQKLEDLKRLYDQGIVSAEEYEQKRVQLLEQL